ncbi:hypothetical protein EC991_002928 [Linnemannia zychae]|nr:hypothetical protein EC991_002928 [Linnemannia zychae]
MSTTHSRDSSKRMIHRDEKTTKFWSKVKRIYSDRDLNTPDKIQDILSHLNIKFNKENPHMTSKAKQELLSQMEESIEEGLSIIDEAEKVWRTARAYGVTQYLDRVQTVLEGRL